MTLGSFLHSNSFGKSDKHLLFMVVLELAIDCILMQVLDTVPTFEMPLLNFFKVPSNKVLPCRCDNASLVDLIPIVEPCWCKVDALDLKLDDIFGVNS